MELGSTDACNLAAQLELEKVKKITFDPSFGTILEKLLLDIYAMLRPSPSDYEQRRLLLQVFNMIATKTFGDMNGFPTVKAFGSFIMDLFTAPSDLDLSINFSNDMTGLPRKKKISVLRKFAKVLYAHQRRGCVTGVSPIMSARVPVLKVVDCGTGIECDISVDNKDGILRSVFYTFLSSIDERFQILSCLMKTWAKAHGINSSKDHTMNSLTIISLVAFHLQTRSPPILPPFSSLLKDGVDISIIQKNAVKFKNFGKRNQESVAELFISLFAKLSSAETLWQHGLCASTYEGSWISKTWKSGIGFMSVEDFVDRSENFARAVGKDEIQRIYRCIQDSFSHLSNFMMGHTDASTLKKLLFESISAELFHNLHVDNEGMQHKRRKTIHVSATPPNPRITKRARHEGHGTKAVHASYNTPTVLPIPFVHPIPLQPNRGMYGLGPSLHSVPSQPSNIVYDLGPSPVSSQLPFGFTNVPQLPIVYRSSHAPEFQQLPYASQLHYGTAYRPFPPSSFDVYHGLPRRHH